jgi:hypothetical protein
MASSPDYVVKSANYYRALLDKVLCYALQCSAYLRLTISAWRT